MTLTTYIRRILCAVQCIRICWSAQIHSIKRFMHICKNASCIGPLEVNIVLLDVNRVYEGTKMIVCVFSESLTFR